MSNKIPLERKANGRSKKHYLVDLLKPRAGFKWRPLLKLLNANEGYS